MSKQQERSVSDWVGLSVRRTDDDEGEALGPAIVLAVDDTAYGPSAWIKYSPTMGERSYPTYRSVDLSDLEEIGTEIGGPRWGTGGPDAALAEVGATVTGCSVQIYDHRG